MFVLSDKVESSYVFYPIPKTLPDHIKQIIVSALDAEIKKLDEE